MSSSRRSFLASVLAVGVAGCTELSTESEEGPTPTEDPEFGTETPADSTPADAPEYAVWSRETPADKLGPVSLGGGPETPAPFVASAEVGDEASDDHTLQALELQDGPERWRLGVADPAQTPPEYLAVDDRSLFVVATGRESLHGEAFVVHAVDPEARERLWRFDTDDRRFLFPMAVDDGTVFVGRRDGQFAEDGEFVYALDGADGEGLWRTETGDVGPTGHAARRGVLFADTTRASGRSTSRTARRDGAPRRNRTPTTTAPNGSSASRRGS